MWAVISPFNFPLALAAGPAGGALVAGNTVVFKPASATPLLGYALYEVMAEAGIPPGVFNFVTGGGSTAGQELIDNDDIDGIVFTGSKDVGMHLIRDNAARAVPRPLIIEMGGKNPALDHERRRTSTRPATASCDRRSARRGRNARPARASTSHEADPRRVRAAAGREDEEDQDRQPAESRRLPGAGHQRGRGADLRACGGAGKAATAARSSPAAGASPTASSRTATSSSRRSSTGCPPSHPLFSEELFVPITVLGDVMSLDEAIDLANGTEYGLTAGIFSEDDDEIEQFFERIQAGVTYANRRAGATTGAWPGINSFGGWKASGSTGRGTGGPYYVQQFMREQSRVRIR